MSQNYVLFLSFGDTQWVQRTVLSILSFNNQLHPDSPKLRIGVLTDRPRYFKSYFKDWVEIFPLKKQEIAGRISENGFTQRLKISLLRDFVRQKDCNVLYLDSDIYIQEPVSQLLNDVNSGKALMWDKEGAESAMLGFGSTHKDLLDRVMEGYDNLSDIADPAERERTAWSGLMDKQPAAIYHYSEHMNRDWPRIEAFFNKHYYREVGELYQLVGLWTPDKWQEDRMQQELL